MPHLPPLPRTHPRAAQLYRGKLAQLVAKGKLSEADAQELARIRRILCISQEMANKESKATAGEAGARAFARQTRVLAAAGGLALGRC